jgi:DNA-nicking Smr family endonuclease
MKKPRRRQLTSEEVELWRIVVKNVIPLEIKGLAVKPALPAPPPVVAKESKPKIPRAVQRQPVQEKPPVVSAPVNPESAYQMHRGWDRKLRRGTVDIDGTIDLHGLTREAAFSVLHRFLLNAIGRQNRCLLVITGKGGRVKGEGAGLTPTMGVLKSEVPRWLYHGPLAEHILSVEAAHPRDGGSGAYYVILRRQRGQGGGRI